MARANSGMPMVMYTKVSGEMIRPMATECMSTLMALGTKDTGRMISKMVRVLRVGLMAANTKVNTKKA